MSAILENGKECTLADLFGGSKQITIPDLQRDYCWGKDAWVASEKKFLNLVDGFVESIFHQYDEVLSNNVQDNGTRTTQTLGLIYGYELPKGHIQICDGQQRLTTLFLLLGFINMKSGNVFSKYLLKDAHTSRLQYAIRESTLYFLNDLVKEVFIHPHTTSINAILGAKPDIGRRTLPEWYFREYDLDSSIQNIIAAIESIERFASKNKSSWENKDWEAFGIYLLNDINFIYYDMGSRSRGEETYIVINITGEPLSPNEHIKPIVIGTIDDEAERKIRSEEWEDREHWFWQNRASHKTSDLYSYIFLVWYWQIGMLQHEVNPRNLFLPKSAPVSNGGEKERWENFSKPQTIQSYFEALKLFVEKVSGNNTLKSIIQTISKDFDGTFSSFVPGNKYQEEWQSDVILPSISYLHKFPQATQFGKFIARLRKNCFDRLRVRNPLPPENKKSSSYVDWRHIIQIIEKCKSEEDVFIFDTIANQNSFKKIRDVNLNIWFGTPEKDLQILIDNGYDATSWADHRTLMGDLTPIIVKHSNGTINFNLTLRRWKNLSLLSICIDPEKTEDKSFNPEIANWYRLYRVLEGIIGIYHQPQTPWNLKGCLYSTCWGCLDHNFSFISTNTFSELLDADNLLDVLKMKCASFVINDNLMKLSEIVDASQLLKAFLFAKTLISENTCVSFYNYYPISVDMTIEKNKIVENLPMNWDNVICRYGYKRGLREKDYTCNWSGSVDTQLDGKKFSRLFEDFTAVFSTRYQE